MSGYYEPRYRYYYYYGSFFDNITLLTMVAIQTVLLGLIIAQTVLVSCICCKVVRRRRATRARAGGSAVERQREEGMYEDVVDNLTTKRNPHFDLRGKSQPVNTNVINLKENSAYGMN